jgi:hypothetical protein
MIKLLLPIIIIYFKFLMHSINVINRDNIYWSSNEYKKALQVR